MDWAVVIVAATLAQRAAAKAAIPMPTLLEAGKAILCAAVLRPPSAWGEMAVMRAKDNYALAVAGGGLNRLPTHWASLTQFRLLINGPGGLV